MRSVTSDGATALIQRADTGGGDAGIEGTLARTDGGCYGLRASPRGDGVVRVVIWPAGFELADSGLLAPDGTIAEGDHVTGAGDVVNDLAARYGDAVTDCDGSVAEGFAMWAAEAD